MVGLVVRVAGDDNGDRVPLAAFFLLGSDYAPGTYSFQSSTDHNCCADVGAGLKDLQVRSALAVDLHVPVRTGSDPSVGAGIQDYDMKVIIYGENSADTFGLIAVASPGDYRRQRVFHRFDSVEHCFVATVNLTFQRVAGLEHF
jgi:hypothetical protein